MTLENDWAYYQRRAQQQLFIASRATDPAIKAIHLDLAARYATLSELAAREASGKGPNTTSSIELAIGR
ncbi:hypothetical protein FHT00_003049 [Sphingomonas insulae]|uniref:Uncharacterized protein n=1 Tax=Sphingomonas insulae TaxID=424800 RepID=A0ABN1HZD3_9SPHN|nr:hypothetical protein [Sphingomonas insulae]NIJ31070.1 hypothetical protein [Sphingomonas insulae]